MTTYIEKKKSWISLSEIYPEENSPVWVLIGGNIPFQGMWTGSDWMFPEMARNENGFLRLWSEFPPMGDSVTHWMEIDY